MELELECTQLSGYDAVLDTTVCCEETMEMIVPDACPDILRICDTEGIACLKGKEIQNGRAEVTGTAKTSILYVPDGADGMRRLEVNVPFSCGVDNARITDGCILSACPRVQYAETRVLNPRKVLVRLGVTVSVQVFAPLTDALCASVEEPEQAGIEQLIEPCQLYLVSAVQEKPFGFADDVTISSGKPEAEELLNSRISLRCSEAKVIGNKLIFKGDAVLQILYRAPEGALCTAEYALPFSQIIEVNGAGEECDCQVEVVLTDAECRLDSGDGRTISVTLGLLAQAAVWETKGLELLTDVYSTNCPLQAEKETYKMTQLSDRGMKSQPVREILETGMVVTQVIDTCVALGECSRSCTDGRMEWSVETRITVLCHGEDNATVAVTRTIQVPCTLDLGTGSDCVCRCQVADEVFAVPTSGGVEVRFQVDFSYRICAIQEKSAVSAISLNEEPEAETGEHPSIVLRMISGGERLWDIAKAYRTTSQAILQANSLNEEELPVGQLLLIPRSR